MERDRLHAREHAAAELRDELRHALRGKHLYAAAAFDTAIQLISSDAADIDGLREQVLDRARRSPGGVNFPALLAKLANTLEDRALNPAMRDRRTAAWWLRRLAWE